MITLKEVNTNPEPVWAEPVKSSAMFDGASRLEMQPPEHGNTQTFTISFWFKCAAPRNMILATSTYLSNNYFIIGFSAARRLWVGDREASTWRWIVETDGIFTDEAAWYHVVVAVDTTAALATDRIRLFVNGRFASIHKLSSNQTYPSYNHLCRWNNKACIHNLGASNRNIDSSTSYPFQGYMANFHSIDGASLDASHFGSWSTRVPGLWTASTPSIDPGLNGAYLRFDNAADLGENDLANGILWANVGQTKQAMDTPSNNQTVLNSLAPGEQNITYDDASRAITTTGPATAISSQFVDQGKWYAEFKASGDTAIFGIHGVTSNYSGALGSQTTGYGYAGSGEFHNSGTSSAYGQPYTTGDIIGVLLNMDDGTLSFTKNGVHQGVAESGLSGMYGFAAGETLGSGTSHANFGAAGFAHEPPDGFISLCTNNLTPPLLANARAAAQIVMREGGTSSVSLPEMKVGPDLVLSKSRDLSLNWQLVDRIRGEGNVLSINTSDAQFHDSETIVPTTDGYRIGTSANVNTSGQRYLDICLRAGKEEGLSILRYTGDGLAGKTIQHGLGQPPACILIKGIDTISDWYVYHQDLGETCFLRLNSNAPVETGNGAWNNTAPDAMHITLGNSVEVNEPGKEFIAYAFAQSEVFRPFSYTGNGSVDGPLIPLGGTPLAIPFLKGNGTLHWVSQDTCRTPFNPGNKALWPNLPNVEYYNSACQINFLSNGIKIATAAANHNTLGVQYVGLAILSSIQHSNAY
ncbi:MAG: hypothetical protein CL942_11735 [Desulfovibrio sp.]|nr:hypothetical protein [Desulfovibrio sp.]|tara:strand:+ start:6581 stop:8830 length:2250 start_codon:yes stop_codon:yes gene_type:complete